MKREEIAKLLGGYATGNLTPDEERALCEAALEDQGLFDALAGEQALRDVLSDPAARAHLLAAMERPRARTRWLVPGAVLATAAALVLAVAVFRAAHQPVQPVATVAEVRRPEALPAPPAARPKLPVQQLPVGAPGNAASAAAPPAPPAAPRAAIRKNPAEGKPAEPAPPAARPKLPVQQLPVGAPANVTSAAAPPAPPAGQPAGQLAPPNPAAAALHPMAGRKAALATSGSIAPPPAATNPVSALLPMAGAGGARVADAQAAPPAPPAAPVVRSVSTASHSLLDSNGVSPAAPARVLTAAGGGLKWTVLRRQPDGSYAQTAPGQLHSGDAVKLAITPDADGLLTVTRNQGASATTLVRAEAVERGKPFELPLLSDKPEIMVLRVEISPRGEKQAPTLQTIRLVFR